VNGFAVNHNRPGADEADSAHDLRRYAAGITLTVKTVLRYKQHQR
jgi:hypothetical protein